MARGGSVLGNKDLIFRRRAKSRRRSVIKPIIAARCRNKKSSENGRNRQDHVEAMLCRRIRVRSCRRHACARPGRSRQNHSKQPVAAVDDHGKNAEREVIERRRIIGRRRGSTCRSGFGGSGCRRRWRPADRRRRSAGGRPASRRRAPDRCRTMHPACP